MSADKNKGAIESLAPARVNDLGGWTDTWFSGSGRVLAVAVSPGVSCRLSFASKSPPGVKRFTLEARNFDERYSFDPDNPPLDRHPLLEAAVACMGIPSNIAVEASISSELPPGCGTGTSAAAVVTLIGALDLLASSGMDKTAIWKAAHMVEAEKLGWESGIQDQICATFGGICFIDIYEYPEANISRLDLDQSTLQDLWSRLLLVYLGKSRKSTAVHREVISGLSREGGKSPPLSALKEIPLAAREALTRGDLVEYGKLMVENNEKQRALHPGLISEEADSVIEVARKLGALGWKVNGAGGQGGSLTILVGDDPDAGSELLQKIGSLGGGIRSIPIEIDRKGLRVESR